MDPYHLPTLLTHIGCLYELGKKNDLYILGHKLVDVYPKSYMSWYVVGITIFQTNVSFNKYNSSVE